ncbi:MAG: molybdenum cofactor biosynthesis protein MoaE [Pseudomonadota bacterium]
MTLLRSPCPIGGGGSINHLSAAKLLEDIRNHPEIARAGMILCHNGIVRSTSRAGQEVSAVRVNVDKLRLAEVIGEIKARPGIIDFLAELYEGELHVGEDLMILVMAGDFRENVFSAMRDAIDTIKTCVVQKEEITLP